MLSTNCGQLASLDTFVSKALLFSLSQFQKYEQKQSQLGMMSQRISELVTSDSEIITVVSVLIQRCTLPESLWRALIQNWSELKNQFFSAAKSAPNSADCLWKSFEQRWFFVDSDKIFSLIFIFFSKYFKVLQLQGT